MISRKARLGAAQAASRVLARFEARKRIDAGYTRIDPIEIAEAAGLFVMVRPLDRLVGAFLREEPRCGVLLNSERPIGMMHMTCAHELGHYFLGHKTTADAVLDYDSKSAPAEQEADQFAYSLMTPGWLIAHLVNRYGWATRLGDPESVYQLSLRLGLSYEATARSLEQQRRINRSDLDRLLAKRPIDLKRHLAPPGVDVSGNQDVWMLTEADDGTVVEPRDEDHIFVALPSHASAGFMWGIENSAGPHSLKPMPVRPAPRTQDIENLIVGGTDRAVYELRVNGDGPRQPLRINLTERQPWSGTRSDRVEVKLVTQYDEVEDGLSRKSISARLQEFAS